MSFSDLAAIGSFISGVAVVITFLFLTAQLRQATMQMHRGELNAAQAQFAQFRLAIVNNRDVAELWSAGTKDGTLDPVDEERFTLLLSDLLWSVFNVWERHSRGISLDIPSSIPFIAPVLATKRGTTSWQQARDFFPANYVRAIEQATEAARDRGIVS